MNLIVGIIALINVIYTFFGTNSTASILMFDVNIWVYRLFWTLLAAGCFYAHFKKTNKAVD
ncbi:hypothetical protein DFQ03_0184 [Maribacter caenipelagi]|uniref:Uncharacterized protein n=1 Tax=Maribacter caenipelagi TaxID=1447781 RepID=A0A4V6Q058_9FLAO|nr:hypothetical protein DFQ03_0184 [Maribacter caenipelagi]